MARYYLIGGENLGGFHVRLPRQGAVQTLEVKLQGRELSAMLSYSKTGMMIIEFGDILSEVWLSLKESTILLW